MDRRRLLAGLAASGTVLLSGCSSDNGGSTDDREASSGDSSNGDGSGSNVDRESGDTDEGGNTDEGGDTDGSEADTQSIFSPVYIRQLPVVATPTVTPTRTRTVVQNTDQFVDPDESAGETVTVTSTLSGSSIHIPLVWDGLVTTLDSGSVLQSFDILTATQVGATTLPVVEQIVESQASAGSIRMGRVGDAICVVESVSDTVRRYDSESLEQISSRSVSNIQPGSFVSSGAVGFVAVDSVVYRIPEEGRIQSVSSLDDPVREPLTLSGQQVYAINESGGVDSVSVRTGRVTPVPVPFDTAEVQQVGIVGTDIIVTAQAEPFTYVAAIDRISQTVRWQQTVSEPSSPVAVINSSTVVLCGQQSEIVALSVTTGSVRWRVSAQSVRSGLSFGGLGITDHLYYPVGDGRIIVIDTTSGQIVRTVELPASVITSIIPFGSGVLFVSRESGSRSVVQTRLREGEDA